MQLAYQLFNLDNSRLGLRWLRGSAVVFPLECGFDPSRCSLHVDVSLGKILNPELLPMAWPTVCECV